MKRDLPDTEGRALPTRRSALAAAVVIAAVIAAVGVLVVVPHVTIAGVLGLLALTVCLISLYRQTAHGPFSPVAVTFWSFVAVWACFAPLLQIRDNRLPWPDLPLYQYYVTAQITLVFALVSFALGYRRRRSDNAKPSTSPAAVRRFDITVEKAVVVAALGFVLALVCLPLSGGLLVRFTSRGALQDAIEEAGLVGGKDLAMLGLVNTLPAATSVVALILCILCLRQRIYSGLRAKRILIAATVVAAFLNVVYNNPLSANRFASFSVMLAVCLAAMRFDTRRWRVLFTSAMVGGLAVIYPLADAFRNERSKSDVRIGLDAYYTIDFDGFQQTVNAVHYVSTAGHTWGYHILSATFFWVPRSLWEEKAVAAGNVVAASRGYSFQNLALPFWAEAFVEFSLVGVIVLFYFYGRLAKRLDAALTMSRVRFTCAFAVIFAAVQIGLLRGPLGAQIPFAAAAFVLLAASLAVWRGRGWGLTTPSGSPPSGSPPSGRVRSRGGGGAHAASPRIAVVADWWWPESIGGAERSARAAALQLARHSMVAIFVPARRDRVYLDGPLEVHAIRRPFARRTHADSVLRRGIEFLTAWLLPGTVSGLVAAIDEFGPDVLVATNISRTGPWLLRWAKKRQVPFVRSYHDLSDTCWRRSRMKGLETCVELCRECKVKARLMRSATPASAVNVCVSRFVQSELIKAGLTAAESSVVAYPLTGPTGPAAPVRRAGREVVLGYIGRLDPVKGVEAVIRTAASFTRHCDKPISVLVAGSGRADYRNELERLAVEQGVDARFVDDMPVDEFCQRVDAVIIPSKWMEPFGRVPVEIGARLPMLISPVGGLPESADLAGGRHAFTDFRDPDQAARALASLLDPSAEPGLAPRSAEKPMSFAEGIARAVMRAVTPGEAVSVQAVVGRGAVE